MDRSRGFVRRSQQTLNLFPQSERTLDFNSPFSTWPGYGAPKLKAHRATFLKADGKPLTPGKSRRRPKGYEREPRQDAHLESRNCETLLDSIAKNSLSQRVSGSSGRMFGASTIRLRGSRRPVLQPAPALACAKDSIRVAAGLRRTDFFKSAGCLVVQLQLGCAEVVAKMLDRARTDDRRDDAGAVCDPAQRDLARCRADLLGDANNGLARADRPGLEREDQARQGLRSDPASRAGGGRLPRDGRAARSRRCCGPKVALRLLMR